MSGEIEDGQDGLDDAKAALQDLFSLILEAKLDLLNSCLVRLICVDFVKFLS